MTLRVALLCAISLSAFGAPLFRTIPPMPAGLLGNFALGDVMTADFNGDDIPDVASSPDDTIAVALNDGFGGFAPAIVTTLPGAVQDRVIWARIGDVDGDGDQDVVYVRGSILCVLLGNGDGTFNAGPSGPPTLAGPLGLGDFNGDGKLDAVTATPYSTIVHPGQTSPGTPGQFSMHFGDGSGGFASGVVTPMNNSSDRNVMAKDIVIANLDGDPRPDIIVTGVETQVFVSTPAPRFVAAFPDGAAAVSRFDADAIVDLAILANRQVRLYRGHGDGTFSESGAQWLPGERIACADVDHDGITDILTSGGGAVVARGIGNGSFQEPLRSTEIGSFVIADFDRDGKRDLASVSAFARGNGDGTFFDAGTYFFRAADVTTTGASARDVDQDGLPDVTTLLSTAAGTTDIAVRRGDGTGRLLPVTLTPTTNLGTANAFLVDTIDGDAFADAVVIATNEDVITAKTFLSNGDATFAPAFSRTLAPSDFAFRLADVTGDGAKDLVAGSDVYEGNGDGSFDQARSVGATFAVVGDVDGNGTLDAIWASGPQIAVALNSGGGNFSAPLLFGSSSDRPRLLGDFDGDDVPDLFCTSASAVVVYRGSGDGTFHDPLQVEFGSLTAEPWTADFDGDGNLDVFADRYVFRGSGDRRFSTVEPGPGGDSAAADFDANGTPDVATIADGILSISLTGLAHEPTVDSATVLTAPTSPMHATPATYPATVSGAGFPLSGFVLYAIDGVPVRFAATSLAVSLPPQTAASTAPSFILPTGTYSLSATFLGNGTYRPSSSSMTVIVARASTSLQATGLDATYGSAATVTWTMQAVKTTNLPGPGSTYTISEGGVVLSDVQWFTDHVVVRGLEAGVHSLTLAFGGDEHYEPSTATVSMTIFKRFPQVRFSLSPSGVNRLAGAVTITASVSVPPDYGSTNGSFEFLIDQKSVQTVAIESNQAEWTVDLAAGVYVLELRYGGDTNTYGSSLFEQLPVYLPAGSATPTTARMMGGNTVAVEWKAVADANGYAVYQRLSLAGAWQWRTSVSASSFGVALTLPTGTTRMYAVARTYGGGSSGPIGPPDIVTNVAFDDDPVAAGTPLRASHVTQLRTAINAVRTFAGLSAFPFTAPTVAGAGILAAHFTELRSALAAARNAIGMPLTLSTAPVAGASIRAAHLEELRAGVR